MQNLKERLGLVCVQKKKSCIAQSEIQNKKNKKSYLRYMERICIITRSDTIVTSITKSNLWIVFLTHTHTEIRLGWHTATEIMVLIYFVSNKFRTILTIFLSFTENTLNILYFYSILWYLLNVINLVSSRREKIPINYYLKKYEEPSI